MEGCKVGPEYKPPQAPVSQTFTQVTPEKGIHLQVGADLADWWSQLNDPILGELVHKAVTNNYSLREAALRVQQARAQVGVTMSELYPQVEADGSYTLSKRAGSGRSSESWQLGTSMSWEIDVFGRLKRYTEAAVADLEVERELYNDTYIILLADVASNYVTARAYQRQIAVAVENIHLRRRTLELTRAQVGVGRIAELDVRQAEGSLLGVEAELPELEAGLRHALNRLNVLLGMPPGSYADELLRQPAPIPRAPEQLAVGLPAELLRRRPDIRAAEKRIVAQTERVGGAVADLYPMFSLVGDLGVNASSFSGLWKSDNITASVSPGFRWNILNFGRYRSNIRGQEFRQMELIATYQESVLLAAEEVDNALASYAHEKVRCRKLAQAVQTYNHAYQLSEARYETGVVDFLRVLDSQREKLSFETQLTISEANLARSVIELYRALGGGWQHRPGRVADAGVPAPENVPPAPALEPPKRVPIPTPAPPF